MANDSLIEGEQAWLLECFRELLSGDQLTGDEKGKLSREILQIVHEDPSSEPPALDDSAAAVEPFVRSFLR